jgi:hypothetical protein
MELAYVAHSERCALLLDEDGVCRWVVPKVESEEILASAQRCIGARFVATLDPQAAGLLGHEPAIGKNMLLARVDDGRVSLVRFGPLVHFEKLVEPKTMEVEVPGLGPIIIPEAAASEPVTIPGTYSILSSSHEDSEDEEDDEDGPAYRPSGSFIIQPHPSGERDNVEGIETVPFQRTMLMREPRRVVRPRRH